MMTISNKAAEKLREELIHKCFETDIGFRLLVNSGPSGKVTFSIKLDMQHEGDVLVYSNDVRVFLDPRSAAQISSCQLGYQDGLTGGFFLKKIHEEKDM